MHYIYMDGEHGCIPYYISVSRTLDDAVEEFCTVMDKGPRSLAAQEIRATGYTDHCLDGASYASINTCDCAAPWNHCENGDRPGYCYCYGCEAKAAQTA